MSTTPGAGAVPVVLQFIRPASFFTAHPRESGDPFLRWIPAFAGMSGRVLGASARASLPRAGPLIHVNDAGCRRGTCGVAVYSTGFFFHRSPPRKRGPILALDSRFRGNERKSVRCLGQGKPATGGAVDPCQRRRVPARYLWCCSLFDRLLFSPLTPAKAGTHSCAGFPLSRE